MVAIKKIPKFYSFPNSVLEKRKKEVEIGFEICRNFPFFLNFDFRNYSTISDDIMQYRNPNRSAINSHLNTIILHNNKDNQYMFTLSG